MKWTSLRWVPFVCWLVGVVTALVVVPLLIRKLSAAGDDIGLWARLGVSESDPEHWLTPENVLLVFGGIMLLRWLARARKRVVIEDFVDYTSKDQKAVSGLSTLLVAELARLSELYREINDQLLATSVGVIRRGGAGSATDPGAFLTVRADDVTDVLSSPVASESKLSVGPVLIPVGTLFALVGRLARGPRVLGSVHLTEAGGGPMLTAQITRRGSVDTWKIDAPEHGAQALAGAFLDPMVAELACRMFTDLTLRGSVRWRAIRAFTEYLRLYWESLRTPKHRARYLRQAEGQLMEAIAEDEEFDLAFYNLGVVYTQLAETERRAAADADTGRHSNPESARDARIDAAVNAFRRALQLNPGRWDAVYALAVHAYMRVQDEDPSSDRPSERERHELERVVELCDRVIALNSKNSQAHDLKGMARLRLGEESAALINHRKAVRLSWGRLCRAEYEEIIRPSTEGSVLPAVKENAAAALHNRALAQHTRARSRTRIRKVRLCQLLSFERSDLMFRQALSLAPQATVAATEFARGQMREDWGRPVKAADSYAAAARIDRDNPAYWAHLAGAQARAGSGEDALRSANRSLEALAPVFARAHERYPPPATRRLIDRTIEPLRDAFFELRHLARVDEIDRIKKLNDDLATIFEVSTPCPGSIEALREGRWSEWELDQIDLAQARAHGRRGQWQMAERLYDRLFERKSLQAVQTHILHARRARARRKQGHPYEALSEAAQGLLSAPLSAAVRREVGAAHFALEQYEDASDIWSHTLWLTPNDPFLHTKMGLCHWRIAQDCQDDSTRREAMNQAGRYFDQACLLFGLENVDHRSWALLWRGRVAYEQGDIAAAVPDLRAAAKSPPTQLIGSLLLAEAQAHTGNEGLSIYHFRAVLEQVAKLTETPRNCAADEDWGATLSLAEVHARAACGLALSRGSGDTAHKRDHLITDAVNAAKTICDTRERVRVMAQCHDARGELLSRRKDFTRAVSQVELARQLLPQQPGILMHELEILHRAIVIQHDPTARSELIGDAQRTLQRLKRAEGRGGPLGQEGEDMLRRVHHLTPAAQSDAGNGN